MKAGALALATLVIVATAGLFLLRGCLGDSTDRAQVRRRYSQMEVALRAGNTNAFVLFFAPGLRSAARDQFSRFTIFAHPLDGRSGVSVKGLRAEVCPVREYPLIPVMNLGHTIEMIKVEGEWYFTGKIWVW